MTTTRRLALLRGMCQRAQGIRPAPQRAWKKVEEGMVGFVNVKTDVRARATTLRFFSGET